MAGWVLVVSLLFSPGMLPAERPSHLYLNLIPLCFGCSMISMKGVADWTEGQVEVREEECDFNAFGKTKTQTVKNCLYFDQCVNAETHNFVIDHQHTDR